MCLDYGYLEELKDGSFGVGVVYVVQSYENDLASDSNSMTCEWRIDLLGLMKVYDPCKKSD